MTNKNRYGFSEDAARRAVEDSPQFVGLYIDGTGDYSLYLVAWGSKEQSKESLVEKVAAKFEDRVIGKAPELGMPYNEGVPLGNIETITPKDVPLADAMRENGEMYQKEIDDLRRGRREMRNRISTALAFLGTPHANMKFPRIKQHDWF